MGFGISGSVSVPKVEAPKVAAPKVPDPAAALAGAAASAKSTVAGAVGGIAAAAKGAVDGVVAAAGAAAKAAVNLSSVAGALAEVAVSFKGLSADFAMEPHMVLDANASFGETNFEKGPVRILIDLTPEKAQANTEILHLKADDGSFEGRKRISEFTGKGERTVAVIFEDAPMDQTYSLDVIDAEGRAHAMFAKVPYGDLRNSKKRFEA
jgi:hypothetical protein